MLEKRCGAILVFLVANASLLARPEILDRIRDYDMRHSDLLVRIVKDPETLAYAKVLAFDKMAVIYRQSGKLGEQVAPRYLDGISAGLEHRHREVRIAACEAAAFFSGSTVAGAMAEAIARALRDEGDPLVISSCARTLKNYPQQADKIVPALLARLDFYIKNFRDSADDERAIKELCQTLGVMKLRKAFIPLLKILQSRYGNEAKRAAQKAIQQLKTT
ncbi:MAG: hypothetical protein N2Z22_07550 [Turneriella sp.]|nr:hypothetical protein [Turneriella sp.]